MAAPLTPRRRRKAKPLPRRDRRRQGSRSPPLGRRQRCCASWPPPPPGPRDALDGGDTAAALAAMDAICAGAAHSRRLVKAAASGRKPRGAAGPAARPGQLRDLVAAHLAAHPDADFTPHAIGRVLGRSSGAVANALDRLTALGQAQLTSEKPRRYRHQAPAGTPAPAAATT